MRWTIDDEIIKNDAMHKFQKAINLRSAELITTSVKVTFRRNHSRPDTAKIYRE